MSSAPSRMVETARRAVGGKWSWGVALTTVAVILVVACQPGKRLSKANVDEVQDGMSRKQVESILGLPSSVDTKDYVVLKKTTYVYRQGADTITIVFK
ncbi:MAG: outer membrane protein assembly factor BamE, partial [Verrucomicrobiota bacterium]|nr:outer membrane protein assembly factor BamE [Verrucomicrobiota bacterium]